MTSFFGMPSQSYTKPNSELLNYFFDVETGLWHSLKFFKIGGTLCPNFYLLWIVSSFQKKRKVLSVFFEFFSICVLKKIPNIFFKHFFFSFISRDFLAFQTHSHGREIYFLIKTKTGWRWDRLDSCQRYDGVYDKFSILSSSLSQPWLQMFVWYEGNPLWHEAAKRKWRTTLLCCENDMKVWKDFEFFSSAWKIPLTFFYFWILRSQLLH